MAVLVRYDTPDETGESRREKNERFRMGHLNPPAEPVVEGGERIEAVFWRLSRFRSQGMGGPEPLQPLAVHGWRAVTGRYLSLQEIEIIFDLDAAYLTAYRREMAPKEEGDK